MKELGKSIPSVETRLSCLMSVNQLIYLHYITQEIRDHVVKQEFPLSV